ncbi:MAG: hypothetical protein J7527_19005 [Chitinophagaceae bacterium]|nr:hypothetical protein [Chitinophagaceae bacterium]
MKKVIIPCVAVFLSIMTSCGSTSGPDSTVTEDSTNASQTISQDTTVTSPASDTLNVTGVISKIENGKDGYMATLKDSTGKEFVATISIVNLQKSGGEFKRYKEGDKITVAGPSWKDEAGLEHITVASLK